MLIINDGTGPVPNATLANATINIAQFARDITAGQPVRTVRADRDPSIDRDGRFGFLIVISLFDPQEDDVVYRDLIYSVRMPGLPLEQVNYGARTDDKVYHFPRLYLNGSSWLWCFAVDLAQGSITEATTQSRGSEGAATMPTDPATRTLAMRALVQQFDGDATAALVAFARHAEIAVAWMDRDYLTRLFADRGVTLTDEMWQRVSLKMDGFDTYAGDAEYNVHDEYATSILRELGLNEAADFDLTEKEHDD